MENQGYLVVPGQNQHTERLVLFHGLMASLTCDWPLFQMEHLKACAEIAAQRTINWQKFCIKDDCKPSFWVATVHPCRDYLWRTLY